ncbi:RHTO0S08e01926g1_1 [Rhodotorula toruloides]|uniref:RHTO0S08e01926g1_1 n=2 Tax=Rhodotorula toruloides TaxID=5286 RepID=A0A061B0W4_RHOTO|nr:uncharacterized protein RHTO_03538 [Rhodotorula toruloides NP11]EMS20302.1 hypothetical protein RHTO_03538 [Rhodotorula toruloides NP11]CDR43446.1 RHTO0S08e01926g1_1 [Rhodotorula toruloides]
MSIPRRARRWPAHESILAVTANPHQLEKNYLAAVNMGKTATTKTKEPKELSEQQSLWQDFRKRRTEELKKADPDQKSPENPKHE